MLQIFLLSHSQRFQSNFVLWLVFLIYARLMIIITIISPKSKCEFTFPSTFKIWFISFSKVSKCQARLNCFVPMVINKVGVAPHEVPTTLTAMSYDVQCGVGLTSYDYLFIFLFASAILYRPTHCNTRILKIECMFCVFKYSLLESNNSIKIIQK